MDHSMLCFSPYVYGMHEKCPADVLRKGWALEMAEIYHDGGEHPGIDFTWANVFPLHIFWAHGTLANTLIASIGGCRGGETWI